MKTFLPILLLIISFQTYAQNYRTANTGQTTYYEQIIDLETVNVPFKADNFTVQSNGDTLINFLEILDYTAYIDTMVMCVDTASTPWQGEEVLLQIDGTDIYYNENNEAITIKTQANVGETWLLFDENIKVEATLSQIDTQSVLGVIDSVKTLILQVFDNQNNPIQHPLNGQNFELSQSFGFVVAPDFYHFPNESTHTLQGVQNAKLGVYHLNRNDIYDFNVGDEFHIGVGNLFTGNYYQVFILSKQLDADNNWEYTYDVARHVFRDYDFDTNMDTAYEITSGVVPVQLIGSSHIDLSPLPMTFRKDSSGIGAFNRIEQSRYNNRNQKVLDSGIWGNNNGCWSYAFLLGISHKNTYVKGLGGPYGGSSSSGDGITAGVVYYKKGNETYGNPIDFDALLPTKSIINKNDDLKVYPNPAQNFITIEWSNNLDTDFNLLIINKLGEIIQQDIVDTNLQEVPIYHLPKGMYILRIENGENIYVKRFVKL